jgi:hypothetical protein
MEDSFDKPHSYNEENKTKKILHSNYDTKFYEDTLVRLVQRGQRLREAMVRSLQESHVENRSEHDKPIPVIKVEIVTNL